MNIYEDQLGNAVELPAPPKRIISLVPSQTELLFDLGLNNEVVGITKFCVHPAHWFRSKARVGGTKTLDLAKIKELQPDLIIANKEENVQQQVQALQQVAPVWVSDIATLDDALHMIGSIGQMVAKTKEATVLSQQIAHRFQSLHLPAQIKTAYLIWKDPYITVGGDTFIHHLMQRCGFINVFGGQHRYPEISIGQLQQSGCELLLLSSEPYPFKEKHLQQMQQLLPHTTIALADGEMFSWYGSRLLYAADYLQKLVQHISTR